MKFFLETTIKVIVFVVCYGIGAAILNPIAREAVALFVN
tara:strand:- start:58 stop:174 length:117 start_codon:yes stop_codon:yes gene_type:complete